VRLSDIVFEDDGGKFWVKRAKNGYEVYENGSVCATRRDTFGLTLPQFVRARNRQSQRARRCKRMKIIVQA
jgi:hypothetical protein